MLRTVDLGSKGQLLVAPDTRLLFDEAADLFAKRTAAGSSNHRYSVALSGGSTPKGLYELLATEPWRSRLPWRNIHFFWGDERWVPSTDPQSNYRMAREALLSKVPVPPENIHPIETDHGTPEESAAQYEREILNLLGPTPQFDLNLLGLGTNGHTASLFPERPTLHVRDRLVVSDYIPEVQMSRITFTVPLINASRLNLFLLSGKDKAEVLHQVLRGPEQPERLPSQLVRNHLLWLADAPAASLIR